MNAAAASTVEHANGADVAGQTTVSFIFPLENSQYGVVAFSPSTNLGVIREVIPVKEQRTEDSFIRKSLPHCLVSHILGHEALGSLHHVLSDMGYIDGLSSGTSVDTQDFSLFFSVSWNDT